MAMNDVGDLTGGVMTFRQPPRFDFTPQADMTPVEAAYCGGIFAAQTGGAIWDVTTVEFWPKIERHFTRLNEGPKAP